MLSMQIQHLVHKIVEHAFEHDEHPYDATFPRNKAVYMQITLHISSYEGGEQFTESRALHLLFHRFSSSNYTSVWSAITVRSNIKPNKVEWEHQITHDSEWRSPRVYDDVYFAMASQINSRREEKGLQSIAPKDMSECNQFWLDDLYKWVDVEVKKDPYDLYARFVEVK